MQMPSPAPEGVQICKFTIDATGERCVGIVGRPIPFWPDADISDWHMCNILKFDGSRGRIYYTKDAWKWFRYAVAVDLK